jgi:hypothetical protein
MHGKEDECIQILVGKSEGKRPLEKRKRRWDDNIKLGVKKLAGS